MLKLNEIQTLNYDASSKMLWITVHEATIDLDDEGFKMAQYEIVEYLERYPTLSVGTDLRKLAFIISLEMQLWIKKRNSPPHCACRSYQRSLFIAYRIDTPSFGGANKC